MELSDKLEGKHSNQIKIDKTGRFVLPRGVYNLLNQIVGQNPYFLTEYNLKEKEFYLRTPKNYGQEAEKLKGDEIGFRDFCGKHYATIIGTGRRINLAQVLDSDYYKFISKKEDLPKVEGQNIKLSWKQGHIILKLTS